MSAVAVVDTEQLAVRGLLSAAVPLVSTFVPTTDEPPSSPDDVDEEEIPAEAESDDTTTDPLLCAWSDLGRSPLSGRSAAVWWNALGERPASRRALDRPPRA